MSHDKFAPDLDRPFLYGCYTDKTHFHREAAHREQIGCRICAAAGHQVGMWYLGEDATQQAIKENKSDPRKD